MHKHAKFSGTIFASLMQETYPWAPKNITVVFEDFFEIYTSQSSSFGAPVLPKGRILFEMFNNKFQSIGTNSVHIRVVALLKSLKS